MVLPGVPLALPVPNVPEVESQDSATLPGFSDSSRRQTQAEPVAPELGGKIAGTIGYDIPPVPPRRAAIEGTDKIQHTMKQSSIRL